MDSGHFEILAVRAAPEGASYLGKVDFAYRPSEFQTVRITHSAEVGGNWKTFTDAEIEGARTVRVRSAFLCRSKNDQLYVRAQGVDVPWELCRAIAEKAHGELEKRGASR